MDFSDIVPEDVEDIRFQPTHRDMHRTREGRETLAAMGVSKKRKQKPVAERAFIGWDGEGITYEPGQPQSYVLFGSSTGHSVQSEALSTRECLNLILQCDADMPKKIHVGFAFDYDVEMMLRDIPQAGMRYLYDNNKLRWGGYRIEYIPRKWFMVSGKLHGKWRSVKIWDLFSFFGTSFVKSLEKYLDDVDDLQQIKTGKEQRNEFQYDELEEFIKPYWKLELKLLVQLATRLRELLASADINIKQWHGPGAIATRLFSKNKTDNYRQLSPSQVQDAAQYAFAGGRFELFKIGRAHKPVYVYDINSAYPAAFAQLPNLRADWRHVIEPSEVERFGVYQVEYDSIPENVSPVDPQPFFYRDAKSCVHFPQRVVGWYWTPEARLALQHPHAEVTEGWVLDDTGEYPLDWVRELYDQRQAWKSQNIQAEMALKLGINSLYGKTAQRVGWKIDRLPRWHQLEWAGYITSFTRTILWEAIKQAHAKGSLIACETDSVISTEPLDLPLSKQLGEWDCETYEDIIYLQNGVYWVQKDGEWEAKFRGLDSSSLNVHSVLDTLSVSDLRYHIPSLTGTTTRFVGGKLAMQTDINRWRVWETTKRDIRPGAEGKRCHVPWTCAACKQEPYLSPADTLHDLTITNPWGGMSNPHHIPWRELEHADWEDECQPPYIP